MERKLRKSVGIVLGGLGMESHDTRGLWKALDASIKGEGHIKENRGQKENRANLRGRSGRIKEAAMEFIRIPTLSSSTSMFSSRFCLVFTLVMF